MIQYNTKNLSFLKMYTILKDFGIKNCDFFLELNDESLIDVDPFDENLDEITKIRIINEIHNNLWYFLREIVRIPAAGENRHYELTRATLAIPWAILNDLSSFVVLPRQCYKTYSICSIYEWLFYFNCKNTEFMMFSYSDSILQGNLGRIKEIRDTLPKYLNLYNPITDKDNAREMKFVTDGFYNHIRIKAPAKSPEEASRVGRGFSCAIMWFDELNFIPNIDEIYDSSSFAYKTVAEIAKKNHSHHHRIMSSSVGRLAEDSGLWGFNFLNSCCDFTEKMYDYDSKTVKEMVLKNSTNNFLRIEYMYYDLGKPDTYLEEMRKDSTSEEAFEREVLNKWMKSGSQHPLGKDLVDKISNQIHEPSDILVIDDVYFLKLYRKISEMDFDKQYICGVDTGGNLLQDFSTFVVVDPTNYEVVAVLRSNQFSTNRFSKCIANLLVNVFTNSVVIVERNYIGIALCDYLTENGFGLSSRIYYGEDDKPGFATTAQTRPVLYKDLLRIAVINQYKYIHDSHIINEIISLEITRNGRIDHPKGGHDDTLMAYLFTRWFLTYAKNASKYIDVSLIGSDISGLSKVDQERISNKGKFIKSLKDEINRPYGDGIYNSDGTINLANINQNATRDFTSTDSISESMNNISIRLYEMNKKPERNIVHLDNKEEMLENEDEIFNSTPDEIQEKISTKNEKLTNKFQFTDSNIRDIKSTLFK